MARVSISEEPKRLNNVGSTSKTCIQNASWHRIIFASRGCDRQCPYCAVWRIEGFINSCEHTRIILWDNNILQSPHWHEVFDELIELGKWVDFNQGLDARLITDDVAERLSKMRLLCVRISYDHDAIRAHGIRRRSILVYTLYNFQDDPDNFFSRVKDVLSWGAVVYPMRYEPLNALERWKFIG